MNVKQIGGDRSLGSGHGHTHTHPLVIDVCVRGGNLFPGYVRSFMSRANLLVCTECCEVGVLMPDSTQVRTRKKIILSSGCTPPLLSPPPRHQEILLFYNLLVVMMMMMMMMNIPHLSEPEAPWWMNGWMDERMDGWMMGRQEKHFFIEFQFPT
jgi:hypothetical protein